MKIQTVSMKDTNTAQVSKAIVDSLRNTGFLVITDHDIDKRVFTKVYKMWEGFFSHPTYKERYTYDRKTQFGYFPMKSEKAKDAQVADIKEFYHFFGNNDAQTLPGLPVELEGATCRAFVELEKLAVFLLSVIEKLTPAEVITSDVKWSDSVGGSLQTLLRILHYPPLPVDTEEGAVRAAAHEDINLITLLPAATQPGLQVMDTDGNWHDVEIFDSNSIIVNVGDMLEEATGGYYKSTTHRVVNPTNNNVSRFSLPLFLHPKPSTRLSARHTADTYLKERLKELGLI